LSTPLSRTDNERNSETLEANVLFEADLFPYLCDILILFKGSGDSILYLKHKFVYCIYLMKSSAIKMRLQKGGFSKALIIGQTIIIMCLVFTFIKNGM
jgi:hypothetical protein